MAYAGVCVGKLAKSIHTHMWLQRNVSENSKDLLPFIEYILTLSLIPVNPLWMQRASIALEIKMYIILSLNSFEMLVVTCICYTTIPWNFANMYRQQTAFKTSFTCINSEISLSLASRPSLILVMVVVNGWKGGVVYNNCCSHVHSEYIRKNNSFGMYRFVSHSGMQTTKKTLITTTTTTSTKAF